MKKKILTTIIAIAMTMNLSACGGGPAATTADTSMTQGEKASETESAESTGEAAAEAAATGGDLNGDGKIIVGYISKNTVDVFHATINGAAQERLEALVADGTIDEWTGILDGNTDPAKQCDLAQDCINYPCDYVIILPAESTASDPAVTSMADAGIGVIVVNSATDSTESVAMAFAGSDDVYAGELIEYGRVEDIFGSQHHHPYTKGLFEAIPSLTEEQKRLHSITGMMPDPTELPEGCKFHPRCPHCMEICRMAAPETVYISETHSIRCHLYKQEQQEG